MNGIQLTWIERLRNEMFLVHYTAGFLENFLVIFLLPVLNCPYRAGTNGRSKPPGPRGPQARARTCTTLEAETLAVN